MIVWVNVWEEVSSIMTHMGQPDDDLEERLALCERANILGLHILLGCASKTEGQALVRDIARKHLPFLRADIEAYDVRLCERRLKNAPANMREVLDGSVSMMIEEYSVLATGWVAIHANLDAKELESSSQYPSGRSSNRRPSI